MIYPALGGRTDFSLGESTLSVGELAKIADDLGTDTVGITDTMSVSCMIDATTTLAKAGKRLVVGVRLRVVAEAAKDAKPTYIKLWPVNEAGLRSIYKIVTRGFESDRFYYVPRVTWDDVASLADATNLVLTSGDLDSAVSTQGSFERLVDLVTRCRFAAVFYELVPSNTPYFTRQNVRAIAFGHKVEASPVVIQPMFWKGDGMLAYSINASIAERRPYIDYLRPVPRYAPHSLQELVSASVETADAIKRRYSVECRDRFQMGLRNTATLVEKAAYKWAKQSPSLPIVAADPDAALVEACKKGWVERFTRDVFAHRPSRQDLIDQYQPRLKFEVDTLRSLGFAQYFLLVADLVRWAKGQGIFVGPGRGSVGGSLVAYLMGITDVDPIRFGLLFERFINPDRLDLPDADLDFMSTRRGEVVQYLEGKYGTARVAGIVNYNTMGAKDSVRSVGRVHGLSQGDTDAIKYVPAAHGISYSLEEAREEVPEIDAFAKANELLWSQAVTLEGKMRTYGQHAAGVVVAGCDLVERAVIERRSDSRVINWDKRVSEDQGLIKLDVLGLTTLDIFDYALDLIEQRHNVVIDLNNLPLDDQPTLELFSQGRTLGVFQFDGGSVRRLLKEMAKGGTLSFEDLVALNALNRPGPLDAGLVEQYIQRRAGNEMVRYPHPAVQPVLEATYGVLTYQEQIMQTVRALAGFTPGEADGVRKAIGKKDMAKMQSYKDQFVAGAEAGYCSVTLDDGNVVRVHRKQPLRVEEDGKLYTIEEIAAKGLTVVGL